MSIFAQVRNERGEPVDDETGFAYQPLIVGFHDARFPLLSVIDWYGLTIFNRAQVNLLIAELEDVADMVSRDGVLAVAGELGADLVHSADQIVGWDLERDYLPLVEKALEACKLALERQHRCLWFIGD